MWWVSGGGLVWAVKGAPLPPTLTTFAPGTPSATTGAGGALGIPGTIQLSPDRMGFGALGGGQLAIGHWLPSDQRFGFEAGGFFLGSGSAGFAQSSNGSLPLRIPFTNVPPGAGFPLGASSFVLADPGFASGGQTISASLRLWGVEGNGLYRAYGAPGLTVSVLAGLRYLDLREHLSIVSTESLLATPTSYTGSDYFSTKNQFIGAQIGVKAEKQLGQFDGSAVAKVALGDNYQTVSVNGTGLITGTGFGTPPGLTPGGIFSQATNIGQQSRNRFAVVPECNCRRVIACRAAFASSSATTSSSQQRRAPRRPDRHHAELHRQPRDYARLDTDRRRAPGADVQQLLAVGPGPHHRRELPVLARPASS